MRIWCAVAMLTADFPAPLMQNFADLSQRYWFEVLDNLNKSASCPVHAHACTGSSYNFTWMHTASAEQASHPFAGNPLY